LGKYQYKATGEEEYKEFNIRKNTLFVNKNKFKITELIIDNKIYNVAGCDSKEAPPDR
jgi:hypothetical protein